MNMIAGSRVLIAGIVLILLTNVVVITGAIGNRSGEPQAILELTERELGLQRHYNRQENNGISLRLNSTHRYGQDSLRLNMQKLSELGINIEPTEDRQLMRRRINKQLPNHVFVVLEFSGDAYQAEVEKAQDRLDEVKQVFALDVDNERYRHELESAQRQYAWMKNSATRLYSIDAGLDPDELRRRYPDRARYIIATGIVSIRYNGRKNAIEPYYGNISGLDITSIHVPLEHRHVFDNLPEPQYGEFRDYPPRYKVTLAYGKRYEPWIISVDEL